MATYLQGSNKYIPQIQPYQPDLNFYKTVLDTKTAQYEAGYDRVNSIYGTLLNSPLTRQDTSGMRNDFFSKANNEIQRLAGVDLSLEDNQTAAFQVFKPLTTNKLFAKDVNFTKDLYNEYDRSEFFRNCLNEKECGGRYWQGGVDYLQYKAQDFAEADEKLAMTMESPKYVPFVNVVDDAVNFAINSKLEMQTVTSDGRYIYTTTNGAPMQAPLHSYFVAKYGNDQKVADMYNVSAYLQRKNYGQANAEKYGSTQAAESNYIREIIDAADKANREYKKQAQETKETLNAKKGIVEDYVRTKGVDPEKDAALIEYYNRLNDDVEVADNTDNYYKESLDISAPSSIEGLSQAQLAYRADAILARNLLDSDLATAASSYASLTQKQDVKADPIYMENLNFSHQMSLESFKQQNDWKKASWDYANDLEKQLWASKLKTDVEPGKFEKSLGILNSAVGKAMSSLDSWLGGEEDDSDTADSESNSRKKTPEQLKYEADLRENAQKNKIQKETELEYYIHQLRGHTSAQVWQSMGAEKMALLGVSDKNQLLFLDSQEQQINEAKQLYEAKAKGTALTQTDELRANAYAMGWGADVQSYSQNLNEWGPYIKSAPLAKVAAGQGATSATGTTQATPASGGQTAQAAQPAGGGMLQAPTATATADSTKTNFVQMPADSSATAQTTREVSSELPTDTVPQESTAYDVRANMPSIIQVPETLGMQQAQMPNAPRDIQSIFTTGRLGEILHFAENPQEAEYVADAMTKSAADYVRMTTGKELNQTTQDFVRVNSKSYLAGSDAETTSLIGAILGAYSITDTDDTETIAAKVDPVSTEEFKNIRIPSEGGNFLQDLFDGGLPLMANKIETKNAITAAFSEDSDKMFKFKNETVNLIVSKYQNKIKTGNNNEKKSALATLKKIFPKFAAMNLIGANGEIKSPTASSIVSVPMEDGYENAITEYSLDPMFKDDVDDRLAITEVAGKVNAQIQFDDARVKIDQYNIAQVGKKMLTNQGLMGVGDDLASFMDQYLFKNVGTMYSPNSSANNSPLKAVRTREQFTKDMYSNPKAWGAADIMADAAIANANYFDAAADNASMFSSQYGAAATAGTRDAVLGQNRLNPAVAQRLANKANAALGRDPNAWFFNKGVSADVADVAFVVNELNQNGLNGKELLKEAFMETWTSEGRTSEWDVYQNYVNMTQQGGGTPAQLDYQGIPVIGYDKFTKEYGIAAADENTNLQMYTPKNLLGEAYTGQGGIAAMPYGSNFNEGLELAIAAGNQDIVGLIDNTKNVLGGVGRDVAYNNRAFVLDMPYTDVVKAVDLSDEPIEDWDWNQSAGNMFESLFGNTIEGQHKNKSEDLLKLMDQMRNDITAQANLNQFQKLDILEGSVRVYPVAVGTKDMTAYQVTLNGDYVKSKGMQKSNADKVFTILLPTNKADNGYYKRAIKNDWVDLALWANGSAVVDLPGSGKVTITQDNTNNYVMNGQMYLPDSLTGNRTLQQLSTQTVNQSVLPGWLFADQIFQQLFNNYRNIQQDDQNEKATKKLVKNPDALRRQ